MTPFACIHFDWQQFNRGYNSDQWALHFLDDFSKMHFVYTLKAKDQTTRTIQQFTAYVQRQFQQPVKVVHTDNESSLGREFHDRVKQLGLPWSFLLPMHVNRTALLSVLGGCW
jgi:transposase InsO family protein